MLKKSIFSLFIIISYSLFCLIIYNINIKEESIKYNISNTTKEEIGYLEINKINMLKSLYQGKKNNIEENVTIIKNNPNLVVLAAHSGNGPKALFNDLIKLEINNEIILNLNNKTSKYRIIQIEEQEKKGTIKINKTKTNQLILTTCSQKNKNMQLVITSTKLDKSSISIKKK